MLAFKILRIVIVWSFASQMGKNEQPVPKLSVVMATFNRAETIRMTLARLADQTLDPASYEVIVVDDGSPDNTREVAEEWLAKANFRMRYIHHGNHGPGYTQNRGIEVAEAPIVLLMADDILMTPGALAAHLAVHEAHPAAEVAVLGQVLQSPKLDQSVFLRHWDPFRFGALAGKIELPYYRFWACNISAKRDFLMRYGPFSEHKGRGGAAAHEDPELGYKLHQGGLRILYGPEALGYHHHVVTLEGAARRRYMQGLNFGEFRRLSPAPEIPVAYHVLSWSTLRDHFRALFGPRRAYLEAEDRRITTLLARHLARALVFNRLTVTLLWEPLLHRAENNQFLAGKVSSEMYRGLLFHHFLRGVRDGDRRFGQSHNVTQTSISGTPA